MKPIHRKTFIGAIVTGLLALPFPFATSRGDDGPLGMTCSSVTSLDGVTYRKCTGKVRTFDGIRLDVDLSLPVDAAGPLPTVLMMHGWGGDKTTWETTTKENDGRSGYRWNNVWFVSKGYAVVNYTSRGFMSSCGLADTDPACVTGWTHVADPRFETRDSQVILSQLVDAGVTDPTRIAATGGSYGGGQSWLLATSMPWTTPKGTTVQLAAAIPHYGWTDIADAGFPNGRATDDVDQSASHEAPFGLYKESWIDLLYAGAAEAQGRYNYTDLSDRGSALTAAVVGFHLGEPYAQNPLVESFLAAARYKSAYWSEDYFAAIRSGAIREVPVFAIQGWNDSIFPAVELLQMYRKLKSADPAYSLTMVFGDIGHANSQEVPAQWQRAHAEANAFLDRIFAGDGSGPDRVLSFLTDCFGASAATDPFVAADWDHTASGSVVASSSSNRITTSAPTTAADGAIDDPILLDVAPPISEGCQIEPALPSATTWSWEVPAPGFMLLGLPELRVAYNMTGAGDATAIFRLWDVAPNGQKALVTRGVWRIAGAAAPTDSGFIKTKLFGNAWEFAPGHEIQLEVTQTDAPYLRPDNLPSTMTFIGPLLTIPTREAVTAELGAR